MERIWLYTMSMKFKIDEMKEMEDMLKSFLASHNIKLTIPVDIFNIANLLRFDVRGSEFSTDKLEGLILVNEDVDKIEGFDSNKIIAYNCKKDINTKKFIVAHELAHYIAKKSNSTDSNIVFAARDHESGYSNDVYEQKMDYIAAALLIPEVDLRKKYQAKVSQSDDFYMQVATTYNVEFELAKRRVSEVFYGNK